MIVARVGGGTITLGDLPAGSEISLLGPLGNGFDLQQIVAEQSAQPILIGGGSGIPPLYLLAKELVARGIKPQVCLGFRSADAVYFAAEFAELGATVTVTTEDGSFGVPGYATSILPQYAQNVFACGPLGMLQVVQKWAAHAATVALQTAMPKPKVQLSLEAHMGCGFGACLGCTIHTVRGLERVCLEGPVFESKDVYFAKQEVHA
ncbi:hypothetical protein [Arcanobacterium hippocoleae]|uniref:iron-sulfur cluster-binding protein n=1 Tax=Arcanobacterium hippocoleae TaxID=149017 RepID=UPI00333F18E4